MISGDDEIIIIDSQSVLGQLPNAPQELLVSNEADVYPRNKPELADLIDGSIGEGSPFHTTFHYYAQGVGPTTAVLPTGWQQRLIAVRGPGTRGATGWCLEIHDLVLSKYAAGRPKDLEFVAAVGRHGLAHKAMLLQRAGDIALDEAVLELMRTRIERDFGST